MHATLGLAALTLAAACHSAGPPPKPPAVEPTEPVRPVATLTPERTVLDQERACNQADDLWACTIAGVFYHSGDEAEHIPMDVPKAAAYLERGCAGRIAEACAMLILIYGSGEQGVEQDLDRVNSLHMQLCGDGFEDHCQRFEAPVLE